MPESGSNVELAHDLSVLEHREAAGARRHAWLGFTEAIVLAIVAVATAWSGYQASRWEGTSTTHYALYERYTVLSQEKSTLAGQDRLYDIVTFNGWVSAKVGGHEPLATFFVRRFRPEYAVAFRAWLSFDPLHSAKAPAGPIFMPQYKNANADAADRYEAAAARYFQTGGTTRERSDDYVRVTVFLATVLFLTALSQRFDSIGARVIIVTIAAIILAVSMSWLVALPRT
ncbi:MAG TPA: hypothetical protein VFE16_12160 [Candidatus Cybelea sp.]|jgi:hypothetical protein|nr:hypothetical protein [Candidatus Cybelea sp.]